MAAPDPKTAFWRLCWQQAGDIYSMGFGLPAKRGRRCPTWGRPRGRRCPTWGRPRGRRCPTWGPAERPAKNKATYGL